MKRSSLTGGFLDEQWPVFPVSVMEAFIDHKLRKMTFDWIAR